MNSVIINFSIYCPVENVEKMKIVGNTDLLGKWQPENGFPLTKGSLNLNFHYIKKNL